MLKWILRLLTILAASIVILVVGLYIWFKGGYYAELNEIKKELNAISGVEVVNIWGHSDLELEEISARIHVKGKGDIVLYNLSKDSFHYPQMVEIGEINGKSFETYFCNGSLSVGRGLDVGKRGFFKNQINREFNVPEDVINHFDVIDSVINTISRYPQFSHFKRNRAELFISIITQNSVNQDPIYNLIGAEDRFAFARTLNWDNKSCLE